MTIEQQLPEIFAAILREQRDELNRRFVAQAHLAGGIDGEAFLNHLAKRVAPIVQSVADVLPECARGVAIELYDLSLELFAANAIGPSAPTPEIQQVWTDILPSIPKLLSRDAAVLAGSLSNAAFNVARADGGRIDFWLGEMSRLAGACDSVTGMLDCGKILAWRAGMVQYRIAAIDTAGAMPHALAVMALGLSNDVQPISLKEQLEYLRCSPWHCLESTERTSDPQPKYVRTIGDFRGFGGQFMRPPIVARRNDELFATDGLSTWQLLADCYGSLLYRIGGRDAFPQTHSRDRDERVDFARSKLPELSASASSASICNTVVATYVDSHRITIVAMP